MNSDSYIYGLENSNHDFTEEKSFGKNIFTNAFPVGLCSYMDKELHLEQNYLIAGVDSNNNPTVSHTLAPLASLIKVSMDDVMWAFEDSFNGYDRFATGTANRSDLVVRSLETDEERSAFEIKLVAAPTSGTAGRAREEQSCELVVRPPTIEQMCLSIAASYGAERKHELGKLITDRLKNPMNYDWKNEKFMLKHLGDVVDAAEDIIREGLDYQTPFVLNALWRTVGKSTVFDDECFDVFFWSDLAFLQLFTNVAKKAVISEASSIGRPARSVIWLVKSLFEYHAQGTVSFEETHSDITYGGQSDKAGAFSGVSVMSLIGCENFFHPRVPKSAYQKIISAEGIALLSPERRLDGFIKTDFDYHKITFPEFK